MKRNTGIRYQFPKTELCIQCGEENLRDQSFCTPRCRIAYRYKIQWLKETRHVTFWEAVEIIEARKLARQIMEETGARKYRSHNGLPFTIRFEGSSRISLRRSKSRQD